MKKTKLFLFTILGLCLSIGSTISMQAMMVNDTSKVKIGAQDFAVTLDEAKTLDEETIKDENHASVTLLNQVTREFAVPFITVDAEELKVIKTATTVGEYPLTLKIDTASYQDEKTITVTIVASTEDLATVDINRENDDKMEADDDITGGVVKLGGGCALIGLGVFCIKKFKANE